MCHTKCRSIRNTISAIMNRLVDMGLKQMHLTILISPLSILLAQQFKLSLLIKHGGNQGLYGSYIFMFSHHPVSSVKLCFVYRPREVGTAFTGAEHASETEREKEEYFVCVVFVFHDKIFLLLLLRMLQFSNQQLNATAFPKLFFVLQIL